jgi:tRNA modification GTPase
LATISGIGGSPVAALTTGPAPAAIGVIEVSGPGALAAAAACFRRVGGACGPDSRPGELCPLAPRPAPAAPFPPGAFVLGTLHDDNRPLDEAFLVYRPPGESWTGEELVELQCHGGPVLLDAVLDALEKRGVRRGTAADLADRAVRNGKIDRIQAEALACLAKARTPLAARVFMDQFNGCLSQFLRDVLASPPGHIAEKLVPLLATAPFGLALSRPPTVVLAGPPNAGKSSLFNASVGADRAIVHDAPGTTRDPVDDLIAPGGIPIRLVDTAGVVGGVCDPDSQAVDPLPLAAAAESATLRALASAAAILWVVDATQPVPETVRSLAASIKIPSAWVYNKMDLLQPGTRNPEPGTTPAYYVSALTVHGVPELISALPILAGLGHVPPPGSPVVFTTRQRDALESARRALPDAARARACLAALP